MLSRTREVKSRHRKADNVLRNFHPLAEAIAEVAGLSPLAAVAGWGPPRRPLAVLGLLRSVGAKHGCDHVVQSVLGHPGGSKSTAW
ncbi:hypothetical protein [Streptomyces mirabilis]|uniref:hypothetical protein n=1 Tax=Streptomyces mirabilis TaxID=68239 RepID=UPI00225A006A|nr:hypothetical protein [Streptomyces mirabilis]MCX4430355.1 hypothetical protein [Streptomyces mirabilis]